MDGRMDVTLEGKTMMEDWTDEWKDGAEEMMDR